MKLLSFVLISLTLILGCASTIKNTTRTQYVNPSFSAQALKDGGLALLPITAGAGQEGYRRPLGDYLNQYLPAAVPGGVTIAWQSAMDSINTAKVVDDYQSFIDSYVKTSIIDKEMSGRLATALGTRFALLCSLEDFSQTGRGGLGETMGNVSAHCVIIDLLHGDIMQEIIGQATATQGMSTTYRPPFETYADKIARSVMLQIPGSNVAPEVKQEIQTPKRRY